MEILEPCAQQAHPMLPCALLKCLNDSKSYDTWKRVLAQRFSSPDDCVAEIFNPHRPGGAYRCASTQGAQLGWAVYFRFHERAGYDGSMKLVLHSDDERLSPSIFDLLSSTCASEGMKQGIHTLISVVDSKMTAHDSWYSNSPFMFGGAVEASGNSTLKIFYRKLL